MQELNHAQTQDVTGALRFKRITTLAIGEEGGGPTPCTPIKSTSALGSF